jgi:protocatechuate 3,4-dioxygenase beta subunit
MSCAFLGRRFRRAYAAALLIVGLPEPTFAQITAATISGTIKDETGGVLPGVAVEVKNLDTGLLRAATTDTHGYFTIPGLPPGRYEARASLLCRGTSSSRPNTNA